FPDGQLYADLGGFGGGEPADPGEVLGMFLRALGVPAPEVPSALAEQTKLYRSLTAGRSMLVVLDDGFSAAQVKVLVPGPSASMVVGTRRTRLSGHPAEGEQVIEGAPM